MNRLSAFVIITLFFIVGCVPTQAQTPQGSPTLPSVANPTTPLSTELVLPSETSIPTLAPTTGSTAIQPAAVTPSSQLSLSQLSDFTYLVPDFNTQAALKAGTYQDDKLQVRLVEPVAFGDLNGDGQGDAAGFLAVNSGGTGTFFYLIALLDQNGTPVQDASTYLGDRQRIVSLKIEQGQISVDYYTQGPNDGLCCPSQHQMRTYKLENNSLQLVDEQILPAATVAP